MTKKTSQIHYRYEFHFPEGLTKVFDIELDRRNLSLIHQPQEPVPAWAALDFEQCPNCPLSIESSPNCPIAQSLVPVIDKFADSLSHANVKLVVVTDKRKIEVETSLQKALGSMVGIFMVTSGCPLTDKLRPMVRHHLPVASLEETKYRAISMYLLAQFLIRRDGGSPDWEMKKLVKIYDEIRVLNKAFVKRLQKIINQDAGLNAVVILNNFADFVPFSIDEDLLDELEYLFEAYLNPVN